MSRTKLNTKRIITAVSWTALCALVFVVLVAAINKKNTTVCSDLQIDINSNGDNFFVDKTEVSHWINNWEGGSVVGKKLETIALLDLERKLKMKTWVSNAEAFIDDDAVLHISIAERQPVGRIFNIAGASFYVDTAFHILPVSNTVSARVPVFTGFSGSPAALSKLDSNTIGQVISMSIHIMQDPFLMAMIEQVDINNLRKFELIPKIGNQVIYFGDSSDLSAKFKKLKSFYKNILTETGWAKYSGIYLDYKNQVVAKIRDREDIVADSLRTLQLMELLSARAEAQATDSLNAIVAAKEMAVDSTLLRESVERDDEEDAEEETITKDTTRSTVVSIPKPVLPKPQIKPAGKPPAAVNKPQIIMPKRNNINN